MGTEFQQPQGQDVVFSLTVAINSLDLAKEFSSITQNEAVFDTVSILLTTIRVSFLLFCDQMSQAHTQPGHDG